MFKSEMKLARQVATLAGNYLNTLETCEIKSSVGKDIKLTADSDAEDIILNELKITGIPILTEESGVHGEFNAGLRWIIDPLDGSFNYIRGMKALCCTSIALWEDNTPILGVINRFHCNEVIEGLKNNGATCNGKIIKPSSTRSLSQACCATGLSVKGSFSNERLNKFIRLFQEVKKVRMLGSAAIMSSSVAAGKVDIYREEDILLWDVAAGLAIAQAAGAIINYIPKNDDKCIAACFANNYLSNEYKEKLGVQ